MTKIVYGILPWFSRWSCLSDLVFDCGRRQNCLFINFRSPVSGVSFRFCLEWSVSGSAGYNRLIHFVGHSNIPIVPGIIQVYKAVKCIYRSKIVSITSSTIFEWLWLRLIASRQVVIWCPFRYIFFRLYIHCATKLYGIPNILIKMCVYSVRIFLIASTLQATQRSAQFDLWRFIHRTINEKSVRNNYKLRAHLKIYCIINAVYEHYSLTESRGKQKINVLATL